MDPRDKLILLLHDDLDLQMQRVKRSGDLASTVAILTTALHMVVASLSQAVVDLRLREERDREVTRDTR